MPASQNLSLATLWVDIKVRTDEIDKATKLVTGKGSIHGLIPALNLTYWTVRATNAAVNSLSTVIGTAVKNAIDLEYQFMRIERVARELKGTNWRVGALQLAQELSGVSFRQLNEGLEQAAKLGIKGQSNLFAFTKTAAMFANVSGLEPSYVSESLGKIMSIYKVNPSKMDHFANAILAVANDTSLAEQSIMKMVEQTGAMTKQFDLTVPEAIALSATMQQLGMPFEIARTSLVKFLGEIKNPEKVQKAFKLTNEEVDDFMYRLSKNPFNTLIEAFKKLEEQQKRMGGIPYNEALEALSMGMPRYKNSISTLVSDLQLVQRELDVANKGWTDNVDLLVQYTERAYTTKAAIEDMSDSWNIFLADIGKSDAFKDLINNLSDTVGWLDMLYNSISKESKAPIDAKNLKEVQGRLKEIDKEMTKTGRDKTWLGWLQNGAILENTTLGFIQRALFHPREASKQFAGMAGGWAGFFTGQGYNNSRDAVYQEFEKKTNSALYREMKRLQEVESQLTKSDVQKIKESSNVIKEAQNYFNPGDYLASIPQEFQGFRSLGNSPSDMWFSNFEEQYKVQAKLQERIANATEKTAEAIEEIVNNKRGITGQPVVAP